MKVKDIKKTCFILVLLPPRSQTSSLGVRSRVKFYHLASGLICATVLLRKAKVFSLPVPVGRGSSNILPYVTDCSIITQFEGNRTPGLLLIAQGLIVS